MAIISLLQSMSVDAVQGNLENNHMHTSSSDQIMVPMWWSGSVLLPFRHRSLNSVTDQVQSDVNTQGRVPPRPQQDRRKKVPERIAGHAEDDMHDGSTRAAQVGVWRPVGAPKPLQQPKSTAANNNAAVDSRLGSNNTSPLDPIVEDGLPGVAPRQSQWLEVLDAIPLLAQQAAIAVDVSLDGQNGDGPFGWLAAQELRKQQRMCGPGWSHVNCGGKLSVGHCLDHSGLEILNPLSAEVHCWLLC